MSKNTQQYTVTVVDNWENCGAHFSEDSLPVAASMAVKCSWSITDEAFVVGIVAWAVGERIFGPQEEKPLIDWLRHTAPRPIVIRDLLELALGDQEPGDD